MCCPLSCAPACFEAQGLLHQTRRRRCWRPDLKLNLTAAIWHTTHLLVNEVLDGVLLHGGSGGGGGGGGGDGGGACSGGLAHVGVLARVGLLPAVSRRIGRCAGGSCFVR